MSNTTAHTHYYDPEASAWICRECDNNTDYCEGGECLDAHVGDCSGDVEYHSIDPGQERAHPRCDKHWGERLARHQELQQQGYLSDLAPAWFDPTFAGETW